MKVGDLYDCTRIYSVLTLVYWVIDAQRTAVQSKRGAPLCRKSAEPKPIFFGKWVLLMNIYVACMLCMT